MLIHTSTSHGEIIMSLGLGIIKRSNAYNIDPKLVTFRKDWNPRFDFGEIEELAATIKAQKEKEPESGGLLQAIRVKRTTEGFEVVDGERRITAIQTLMKKGEDFPFGIPAKVEGESTTDLDNLIKMFVSNSGKPFLPMEEARAYQRMREAGMTVKDMEKVVGRSNVHIINTLALIEADPALQKAVEDKSVKAVEGKVIAVATRGDKAKQRELVEELKAAGKDKPARKKVMKKVETIRQQKAKSQGRALKIKPLSAEQLSSVGAKVSEKLMKRMKTLSLPMDTDLKRFCKDDDNLTLAYEFGVLEGLKAAAGAVTV
jgi:ParB-like chromosome segregation protein Spo0J